MIRFIILIAIAFAAFWCYNNVDFDSVKGSMIKTMKKEKTIKAVDGGRTRMAEDAENAINNGTY